MQYVINELFGVCFRLLSWNEHRLNRTLFDVPTVAANDYSDFPAVREYYPLEKLERGVLEWLSPTSITLYFDERLGRKGFEKGRLLFMCAFVKSCEFYKDNENIFFIAICSAEMKTNTDYEVKIHIHSHRCEILKAQCQCPAGAGPGAACKHVSAVLFSIEFYAVTGTSFIIVSINKNAFEMRFRKRETKFVMYKRITTMA